MWWGGIPAKLKGLFDRAFLSGTAFDMRTTENGMPTCPFAGRSARLILTSGTPAEALTLFYKDAMLIQLRQHILGFVGVGPVKISHFGKVARTTPDVVDGVVREVQAIAAKGEKRTRRADLRCA